MTLPEARRCLSDALVAFDDICTNAPPQLTTRELKPIVADRAQAVKHAAAALYDVINAPTIRSKSL